jgi:hypothetical protein
MNQQELKPYKIHLLNENGEPNKIIVFQGEEKKEQLFSEIEISEFKEKNIEIVYSDQEIHKDDSIRILKNKIIFEIGVNKISYDEMYLFSFSRKKINLLKLYKDITKNETLVFSPELFGQIILRFDLEEETIQTMEEKPVYTFDDLLVLENKLVKIPLGKRFLAEDDFLFSVNPFEIDDSATENLFQNSAKNQLLSFENELLLNFDKVENQDIFVCFAEDVFKKSPTNEEYISELYFPLLYKQEIISLDTLLEKKENLIKETKKNVDQKVIDYYKTVDVFYNLFQKSAESPLPYLEQGIKTFSMTIEPESHKIVPLDAIFKNIHASMGVPFIKYNPGPKRENIYRLYSQKISKNGKKIPFLSEFTILKLSREIGKKFRISLYVPVVYESAQLDFFIDFEKNGNINIYNTEFSSPISIEQLDVILKTKMNPIIQNINDFLEQTGYKLRYFESSREPFITFKKMNYTASIELSKTIQFDKFIYCISSIFDVLSKDISKGAKMRFKRVENFREMDAQSLLITEALNENNNVADAIDSLMQNYKMTELIARKRVIDYISQHADIRGTIIENPGFLTIFFIEPYTNKLIVEVDNILSVDYLDVLHIYIDSIIRITQNTENTERVKKICRKKTIDKDLDKSNVENVISTVVALPIEQPIQIRPISFGETTPKEEEEEEEEKEEEEEGEFEYLFDYEGEEDEDDNEEKSEEEEIIGGKTPDITPEINEEDYKKFEVNPDGMPLSHPNIFFKRLKKRDPSLFLTKKEGKYDSYSRICPSNTNLQPVILTDEELAEINPSSYTEVLKYGSQPNKQYNYICPRYWCLKTNKSITYDEYKSGVCGEIIPEGAKKVPPGKYVYEFKSEKEHIDKNGEYIDHYPGFKSKDKHPNNKCIPCCFSKWDSKYQKDRRDECLNPTEKQAEIKKEKVNLNYILSIESYPLEKGRYGKLPISVQFLLHVDYSKYISDSNEIILSKNPDEPGCFFRYGVEQYPKQSFLGCLADIYASSQDMKSTPSVQELKKIMTDPSVITLDNFIKYHNGSLVSIFKPTLSRIEMKDIDVNLYEDTVFFQSIVLGNEIQYDFLLETVASYENFQKFLLDDTIEIDHTYLWDMFLDDNAKFIKGGVNLMILEIANNDITDNIEVLCPTNSYLNNYYNKNKDTVILLKHGEFYEPIYLYSYKTNTEGRIETSLIKGFRESMKIKPVLDIIRVISKKYCSPKSSLPRVYEFERNISAESLVELLETMKYPISAQIMNYKNKIIGFLVDIETKSIFVPCYPSPFINNIEIKYMDDMSLWTSYETTRTLLAKINQESKGNILCKPTHKIIEDELIVGVLTQTNQFIRINPPVPNLKNDGLIPIENQDYLTIDKTAMTSKEIDQEREETIQNIYLENQFYSVFRSILKTVLSEYENREKRQEILDLINDTKYTYREKLMKMEEIIRELLENYIVFDDKYSKEVLMQFSEILSCFTNSEEKKYCSPGEPAKLKIPKFNLMTEKENERIYFGRLADELLRYKRIQLFMFQSRVFLINTDYKINDDEFIILQTLLTSEYFKDLIPFNNNSYLKKITYDTAYPSVSISYANDAVSLEEQGNVYPIEEVILETGCIEKEYAFIKGNNTSRWRKAFPTKTKEIEFKNDSPNCSFEVLMYIFKDKNPGQSMTVRQIKEIILNGYKKYFPEFREKIMTHLINGGKVDMMKRVNERLANFDDILVSEEYYLSDLDIWVFANETKTPIILFSSTNLKSIQWMDEATEEKDWIILFGDKRQEFYFIRASPQDKTDKYRNKIPTYMVVYKAFELPGLKEFNTIIEKAFSGDEKYLENLRTFDQYLREPILALKKKK